MKRAYEGLFLLEDEEDFKEVAENLYVPLDELRNVAWDSASFTVNGDYLDLFQAGNDEAGTTYRVPRSLIRNEYITLNSDVVWRYPGDLSLRGLGAVMVAKEDTRLRIPVFTSCDPELLKAVTEAIVKTLQITADATILQVASESSTSCTVFTDKGLVIVE